MGAEGPADQPNDDHRRLCARLAACDRDPRDSAQLFGPVNVGPRDPGHVALQAAIPFGKPGLLVALLGMLFAVAGAAVETCMSNAFAIAQFFGWEWGRHKKPWEAPRFTLAWIFSSCWRCSIVLTGVDVMALVEYAVLFSIVVLPLTYLPLMLLAERQELHGPICEQVARERPWLAYFAIVTIAAAAAIPLYLLTSGGQA